MIREKDLNSYMETWLARRFPRFLGGRFFQGTIRSVTAAGTAFVCTLSRTNETLPDGNTYLCSTPGYLPIVGDVVECVWLDPNSALVLWPVNRSTFRARAFRAAALSLTSNSGFTVVQFDSTSYDSNPASFNASGQCTVPAPGDYHIDARTAATAGARTQLAAYVNGIVAALGSDNATAGQVRSNTVDTELPLNAGDLVDIRWWDGENIARAFDVGSAACYFNIHSI